MAEFGRRNKESDAKYIQFILHEILADSTEETVNIIESLQSGLMNGDYNNIESISFISNFLLKNYFNDLIEGDKDKYFIVAFQALLFENFMTFVRIKNGMTSLVPIFKKYLQKDTESLESTLKELSFDTFSFEQFCIALYQSKIFEDNLFNDYKVAEYFPVSNKHSVIS